MIRVPRLARLRMRQTISLCSRPVDLLLQPPAVDDVADQIHGVAVGMVEEVDQQFVIAALGAEMHVADPDRAIGASLFEPAFGYAGLDRREIRNLVRGVEMIGQIVHGPDPLMGYGPSPGTCLLRAIHSGVTDRRHCDNPESSGALRQAPKGLRPVGQVATRLSRRTPRARSCRYARLLPSAHAPRRLRQAGRSGPSPGRPPVLRTAARRDDRSRRRSAP